MLPSPPGSTLFPYTTLFRSSVHGLQGGKTAGSKRCSDRNRQEGRSDTRTEGSHDRYDRQNSNDHEILLFLRSEEHTSELQSHVNLVCRLLLEKKKQHLIHEH